MHLAFFKRLFLRVAYLYSSVHLYKVQIAAFKMVANDTQAMYGISSHAADLEKFEKLKMESMIATTIKTISTNANAGYSVDAELVCLPLYVLIIQR